MVYPNPNPSQCLGRPCRSDQHKTTLVWPSSSPTPTNEHISPSNNQSALKKKKKTLGAGRNCMQRTKYHHLTSPLRLTSRLPNLAALGNKTYRYIYIYSNSLQKTKLIVIFSTVCGYYNCVTSYPNFMNAVLEKNSWSWSSYLNKLY